MVLVFIRKLLLKNFKSFPSAAIRFEKGVNALVGPNGSGKSNIVDGLMFGFGTDSLKAMRVKKTSDLIFSNHGVGEVLIEFEGVSKDGQSVVHSVKRLIRRDGKTKYYLDGKRCKKYVLEEFLARNSIFTNTIIQQGQVERIIEMSSKQRRGLIDDLANISEYEVKKAEALAKLAEVEQKIREHTMLLHEKEGYLSELKSQKEDAEKYVRLKSEFNSLKATLLFIEVKSYEASLESVINSVIDLSNKIEAVRKEIDLISSSIYEKSGERDAINKEIAEKGEAKQLVLQKEVEQLEDFIKRLGEELERLRREERETEERIRELGVIRRKTEDELKAYSKRKAEADSELVAVEKILLEEERKYNALVDESKKFSSQFYDARKIFEQCSEEILRSKEELNSLQSELSLFQEKKGLKLRELERLRFGIVEDYSVRKKDFLSRLSDLRNLISGIDSDISLLEKSEKEFSERMQVLNDLCSHAREKIGEIEARLEVLKENESTRLLNEVLEKEGVFGTIESLCNYDAKYSLPVQVALGNRLNYVIVDSLKTAEKAIEFLKERKQGRMSFLPLDKISSDSLSERDKKLSSKEGVIGFLIDLIEFDKKFKNAFEYACGDTLLVRSLKDCHPLIGKVRLVTLEGDLVEKAGLVTGGFTRERLNVFKERKDLNDWSAKLEESEAERKRISLALDELRQKLFLKRREKTDLELKAKTIEVELKHVEEEEKKVLEKRRNVQQEISVLEEEIKALDKEIFDGEEKRGEVIRRLSDLNIRQLEAKQRIDLEKEQSFGMRVREVEARLGELKVKKAEYSNLISSLSSQMALFSRERENYLKQEEENKARVEELRGLQNSKEKELKECRALLESKLREQKTVSSVLGDLIERKEKVERELQKLGNEKGSLEFKREDLQKKLNEKEVEKGIIETKLSDIKTQYLEFKDSPVLEGKTIGDKPELNGLLKKVEASISEIESRGVNLKAIELFEQKSIELVEQRKKIEQLGNEKAAVITIINEIEGKKESVFMQAFNSVNSNFQKIFSQIFRGRGTLYLENIDSEGKKKPLSEWGLTIQVQLENKEVKYLELMSGGEKSFIALLFLFAIQMCNPSSVYILDEADAAFDEENSMKLVILLKELSRESQFIVVTHNSNIYKNADCLIGVAMGREGSKIVEVRLNEAPA